MPNAYLSTEPSGAMTMARKTPKKPHDQKTADGKKGGRKPKGAPGMPVADMKMPPKPAS